MKLIDDELFSGTLKYLSTRPYNEVAAGMAGLAQAPDIGKLFADLAARIRTGQLPEQYELPPVLRADPAFSEFYKVLSDKLKSPA